MNAGKIEQAGSPEDIYDRPRSEFVARFIGSSNVVKGKGLDDSAHRLCRRRRCAAAASKLKAGAPTRGVDPPARHRDLRDAAAQGENVVPATVVRQVFLGGSRDYMVEAKDGTQLRVRHRRRTRTFRKAARSGCICRPNAAGR